MQPNIIISVDLETLGINPATAAVIQMAAAAYDRDTGQQLDSCTVIPNHTSALEYGQPDQETLDWWQRQPPEAREVLEISLADGGISMPAALSVISDFIRKYNPANDAGKYGSKVSIVARAPSFDLAILQRHFALAGITTPWAYWQERDHRSLEDALRFAGDAAGIAIPRYLDAYPPAHNALSDAANQAIYLCRAYRAIRERDTF